MTKKGEPQGLTVDFEGAGETLTFARPTFAMMKRTARKALALEQTLSMVEFYEHADDVRDLLKGAAANATTRKVIVESFKEYDDEQDRPDGILDYLEIMTIWDGWYVHSGFDRFLKLREQERQARLTKENLARFKEMQETGLMPSGMLEQIIEQEIRGAMGQGQDALPTLIQDDLSQMSSETDDEPPTSTSSI